MADINRLIVMSGRDTPNIARSAMEGVQDMQRAKANQLALQQKRMDLEAFPEANRLANQQVRQKLRVGQQKQDMARQEAFAKSIVPVATQISDAPDFETKRQIWESSYPYIQEQAGRYGQQVTPEFTPEDASLFDAVSAQYGPKRFRTRFGPKGQPYQMEMQEGRAYKHPLAPEEIIQGTPEQFKLQKPITKEAQQKTIAAGESLARLNRIRKNYDPAFLTWKGKGQAWLSSVKSKAGADLSIDEKAFLRKRRQFEQGVNFEFNAYRKMITGAAAAVKELEDLKKAMISTDLSPVEFEAAWEEYGNELGRSLRIRNKLLREGLKPGTKQFGKELDTMFTIGGDDDITTRGNELEAQGLDPESIADILQQEGYF